MENSKILINEQTILIGEGNASDVLDNHWNIQETFIRK